MISFFAMAIIESLIDLSCSSLHSETGYVDQTSIKDSGKGDSDSNDSDSDSGQAGQKIANMGHQRASSKLCLFH